jgi:NADH dehydrogenase FAD-containing subunit
MAGAIAELKRGPLNSDNPQAAKNISVYLIEAGPRLLPSLSEKLSIRTKKDLEKLGVTVLTQAAVAEVKPRQILFSDGTSIPAEVTIWAAACRLVIILMFLQLEILPGQQEKMASIYQWLHLLLCSKLDLLQNKLQDLLRMNH